MIALRDPMNGLSHFIGALLAVCALTVLVVDASIPAKAWHIVSFSIFGAGLVLLYTASTLYHWLPLSDRGVQLMRRIDHIMIFVLIAATYTPICLIPIRGGWGWSLFGCVWGFALGGIILKIFWMGAPRWLSTSLYLAMGWMAVIGIWPLVKAMPLGALIWLVMGGLFYSLGAVIYALKRPNPWPKLLGFHGIFHILVIMGSASHFWLMYGYIARM